MIALDNIDWHILKLLQDNSRESISSLSTKVNLSRPSVKARILRMEDRGIIEKYTIKLGDHTNNDQITFYT